MKIVSLQQVEMVGRSETQYEIILFTAMKFDVVALSYYNLPSCGGRRKLSGRNASIK